MRALPVVLAALAVLAWPQAAAAAYGDADHLRFADRLVAQLDGSWDATARYYRRR